ncbi:MAG: polysaccharide export protein [Lentisphaerae bacterium]|nr:polysaccharide export protein [Lentisphaerota bacterium]
MRGICYRVGVWAVQVVMAAVAMGLVAGCASAPPLVVEADKIPRQTLVLSPGDKLHVEFFGAPELNTEQTIRRDGKITLKLVGDIKAAGETPEELQAVLLSLYKPQLQIQTVSVIVASPMPVFVTGSVVTPGRFEMERPMTVLEAIMQAGGFDPQWADVRKVVVIRHENDKRKGYEFNFKDALAGKSGAAFYLRPYDIVYVPQKSVWPW